MERPEPKQTHVGVVNSTALKTEMEGHRQLRGETIVSPLGHRWAATKSEVKRYINNKTYSRTDGKATIKTNARGGRQPHCT